MAQDRGPQLAAVLGLFLGLTWFFTALRIYVRLFVVKNWGSDDWLLLCALASFTTYASSSLAGVYHGTGQHTTAIIENNPANLPKALMYWWLCELFYTLTTVLLRCSVAVFLLRICERKTQKWIIYGTMIIVVVFSTFYFLLAIFQCSPVDYFWNQYIQGTIGTCIDPKVFPDATFAHSAISATADWILGLLPIWVIWNLKMNVRTKVSVGIVLSFGLLAGVAAIIRIPTVKVLAITDDFLFATTDVAILSTIEPGVGIVATAACVLRPLFKRFYGLSTVGRSGKRQSTVPSAWRQSRRPNARRASAVDDEAKLGLGAVEMGVHGSLITTSAYMGNTDNHVKSYRSSTHKSDYGYSSDEMPEGIQVSRTVEIERCERSAGSDGTHSDGRGPITPWPVGHMES